MGRWNPVQYKERCSIYGNASSQVSPKTWESLRLIPPHCDFSRWHIGVSGLLPTFLLKHVSLCSTGHLHNTFLRREHHFPWHSNSNYYFQKNCLKFSPLIPNNKIWSINILYNMLEAQEKHMNNSNLEKENNWENKYFNDLPVCSRSVEIRVIKFEIKRRAWGKWFCRLLIDFSVLKFPAYQSLIDDYDNFADCTECKSNLSHISV